MPFVVLVLAAILGAWIYDEIKIRKRIKEDREITKQLYEQMGVDEILNIMHGEEES